MTSQTGQQTIAKHILLNIPKSEGNQSMKFRQLKIIQKLRQGD